MDVLAAIADPVRIQILEMLAAGECTAGEIAGQFPVSGPAISRHLRVLREHELVKYHSDAQRRIYALNPEPIVALEGWAHELLTQWRRRFDALGRHLDAPDNEEQYPRPGTWAPVRPPQDPIPARVPAFARPCLCGHRRC